jgi:hypothetical protein
MGDIQKVRLDHTLANHTDTLTECKTATSKKIDIEKHATSNEHPEENHAQHTEQRLWSSEDAIDGNPEKITRETCHKLLEKLSVTLELREVEDRTWVYETLEPAECILSHHAQTPGQSERGEVND